MAIIGVDLDHTLVEGDKSREYAREAINILREAGHRILIHTCNDTAWTEKVLNNLDIRFDGIWTKPGKPLCDLYLDDKSYHYRGDWKGELTEILARVEGKDNRKW